MTETKDLRFLEAPGDELFEGDFLDAPELEGLAVDLAARHRELQGVARFGYTWRVAWKREGAKSASRELGGRCAVMSGALKHYAGGDWFIWLAADICREWGPVEIEALLYHEMLHCAVVGKEFRPGVRGHDLEMFFDELIRYGLWRPDLREAKDRFGQISMPSAPAVEASADGDVGEAWARFRPLLERGLPGDREGVALGARTALYGELRETCEALLRAVEDKDWPARVTGLAAALGVSAFLVAEAYEGPRVDVGTGEVAPS